MEDKTIVMSVDEAEKQIEELKVYLNKMGAILYKNSRLDWISKKKLHTLKFKVGVKGGDYYATLLEGEEDRFEPEEIEIHKCIIKF